MADFLSREARLTIYLQQAASRPFEWGSDDCCTFGADWVEMIRGVDLAAEFRGKYLTAMGAERFIRSAGGLLALVAAQCEKHGLKPTPSPEIGDVAVVTEGHHDLVAIKTRERWVCKTGSGLAGGQIVPLMSWSV
jgi:hypothetical protein